MRFLGIASIVLIAGGAALSGAPAQESPEGHFRNPAPVALDDAAAEDAYRRVRDELVRRYRLSGASAAEAYQSWTRANRAPYESAQHGQRYVNNYVNAAGAAYLRYEAAPEMPPGAVIAKDSFVIGEDGAPIPGPLFLMEKMPAGFAPGRGDWRYTSIMPDGSVLGTTGGEGSSNVVFCHGCHVRERAADYLFFLPEALRVRAE